MSLFEWLNNHVVTSIILIIVLGFVLLAVVHTFSEFLKNRGEANHTKENVKLIETKGKNSKNLVPLLDREIELTKNQTELVNTKGALIAVRERFVKETNIKEDPLQHVMDNADWLMEMYNSEAYKKEEEENG